MHTLAATTTIDRFGQCLMNLLYVIYHKQALYVSERADSIIALMQLSTTLDGF